MSSRSRRAACVLLRCLALASGLCALSLLFLPLLLALLMLLFDHTAQGVMVLLGSIVGWFGAGTLAGGSGLPPYRSLMLDPVAIALAAAARMAPCLFGLLLAIVFPSNRRAWLGTTAFWLAAIGFNGRLAGLALVPGLVAAVLLATGRLFPSGDRQVAPSVNAAD